MVWYISLKFNFVFLTFDFGFAHDPIFFVPKQGKIPKPKMTSRRTSANRAKRLRRLKCPQTLARRRLKKPRSKVLPRVDFVTALFWACFPKLWDWEQYWRFSSALGLLSTHSSVWLVTVHGSYWLAGIRRTEKAKNFFNVFNFNICTGNIGSFLILISISTAWQTTRDFNWPSALLQQESHTDHNI